MQSGVYSQMKQKQTTQRKRLTILKASTTVYPNSLDKASLETFDNPSPSRKYWIHLDCPEFTALCPITGQPDFGHIIISYIPNKLCVESKSLKLYLFAFRNEGAFHEAVVNRILDDLVKVLKPKKIIVKGNFNRRGGIAISVEANHPETNQ